ncbi:MAG TPA: NAD(P)-binding protein, partial [Gemmatimonadales bacterium]
MQTTRFDAIVVGSGISGGWAAKELTEKGLQVLLLERGRNVEHVKDYPNATKGPWEYPHRGGRTREMETQYPVLRRDYPLNEKNLDWWASDQDSPYTETKRFDWYRAYVVGGRSLLWGRQSYRLSDLDFEANTREGIAIDWPLRYAELAPWYDYVERHAGIAGSQEGLPQLPDGQFLPAMPLNCGEQLIADRLARQFGGRRRIIPGRCANLSRALPGRGACQHRNACWLGCPFGAYFSTQSSTLP